MENTIQQILKRFCIPVQLWEGIIISFFLNFFLLCELWSAESLWETKYYDESDGLSHNTVFCIFQDAKGFIWLGTKDGLNRFDGQQFKIWRQEDGIVGKVVYDIAEDSSNRLWLATDKGVCRFNPKENSFFAPVSFDVFRPQKLALPSMINSKAQRVMVDARDRVWVFAGKRTYVFENERLSDITIPLMQRLGFMPTLMTSDEKGNVCFAYSKKEKNNIVWYNPETDTIVKTISQPHIVTVLQAVPHDRLLVGTLHNGIFIYDNINCHLKEPILNSQNHELFSSTIHDIAFSGNGDVAYAVASEKGLSWLQNDSLISLSSVNGNTPHLDFPWKVLIDKDGGLWSVDYYGGISYRTKRAPVMFSLGKDTLSPFSDNYLDRDSFSESGIFNNEKLNKVEKRRQVVFVGLYARGKEVETGLPYAETVYLAQSQAAVTVKMSVFNYSHSQANRMVYRINEHGSSWKEVDINGCFSYNFRKRKNIVYACHIPSSDIPLEEIKIGDCAQLTIYLEPSLWRTPVAYMVYTLCVIGFVSLYLFRMRICTCFTKRRKKAGSTVLGTNDSELNENVKPIKFNKSDELLLQAVSDYFEEHLTQSKMDFDDMAFTLNMSRSTLYRRVKSVTGVTPNEYCRVFRLNKAAKQLEEGNYLVKEVCRNVGFYSESYFAKMFKKQFGVLPNEYHSIKNNK